MVTAAVLTMLFGACSPAPMLGPLEASANLIRPNGSGIEDEVRLGFDLNRRADVAVDLIGEDGKVHPLRERATRAPDHYEIAFDGSIPIAANEQRVVPDGSYTIRVVAEDGTGAREVREAAVTVVDADTTPVEVRDLQTNLASFTPNGDGRDDELRITYGLSKDSEAVVYATDEQGRYFTIDPWTERRAALQSHLWDGTTGGRVFGGQLLADGNYLIHVEARDEAGNSSTASTPVVIANGGVPRLEITDARFVPVAIMLGGTLDVRITVRNTGTTPIYSWGPAPGHTYTAPEENFASIRDPNDPGKPAFFERLGVWRVGVTWQNAPQAFPLRWGLFPPTKTADGREQWDTRSLAPGESVTVDGHIRVFIKEDSRQVRFAAGVIQEGVGFPDGRVGEQVVQVGW